FGFGFLEVGPVTAGSSGQVEDEPAVERRVADESIAAVDSPSNRSAAALAERLATAIAPGVHLVARLAVSPGSSGVEAVEQIGAMAAQLAPHVSVLAIDPGPNIGKREDSMWAQLPNAAIQNSGVATTGCKVWVVVRPDMEVDEAEVRIRAA